MACDDDSLLYKLALHTIPGIGAVSVRQLVGYLGGIREVFEAGTQELLRVPGIAEGRVRMLRQPGVLRKAESILKQMDAMNISMVFYLDAEYPDRLRHHADSPIVLFTKGEVDLNPDRTVAIVGTRKPSEYGKSACRQLVEDLQPFKASILSGLAYGIDAVAHTTAVASSIPTLGILGSGIDRLYPSMHRQLANRMCRNGGLVSEFVPGTKPDRENFPKRNRIIAAMADIVIVVESGKKGGSIITAEYANNYSKDVFAVPGRISDEKSEGCHLLIKSHKAHLLESVKDIRYIARWEKRTGQAELHFDPDLSDKGKAILAIISKNGPVGIETIYLESGVKLTALPVMLLNLEIAGLIRSIPGKKYILATKPNR